MGNIVADTANINGALAHGYLHHTDRFYSSFAEWMADRLASNRRVTAMPFTVGGIKYRLDQRQIDVSEEMLLNIEAGKVDPDWHLAYEIGCILQDAVGALYSRGFMVRVDNVPKPLSQDGFVSIRVLGSVSASRSPIYAGEAVTVHTSLMPARTDYEDLFSVTVYGDCLEGEFICHLDEMVCRRSNTANDGDIVAVQQPGSDSAFVKRYREKNGRRWLETVPKNGEPEVVEIWNSQIIGVKHLIVRK